MRVKIRRIEHPMEGRQVILQVEKVNEELGEIICTPVAVSGEAPFIDVKKEDYTVTYGPTTPVPSREEEAMNELRKLVASLERDKWKGSWT